MQEELKVVQKNLTKLRDEQIESDVRELVALIRKEKPLITKEEMGVLSRVATQYGKELVKGKVAELYGLSVDYAIKTLKGSDEDTNPRDKKDIALKVLGHCMPQNVHTDSAEVGKRIMFMMTRPQKVEGEIQEVTDAEFTVKD